MHENSTISVANLFKWLTIMTLFVVCGCLFINIRAQQVVKQNRIQELKRDRARLAVSIQRTEVDIKRNVAPGVLEARLLAFNSPLAPVSVEQTEELMPPMTAARSFDTR